MPLRLELSELVKFMYRKFPRHFDRLSVSLNILSFILSVFLCNRERSIKREPHYSVFSVEILISRAATVSAVQPPPLHLFFITSF